MFVTVSGDVSLTVLVWFFATQRADTWPPVCQDDRKVTVGVGVATSLSCLRTNLLQTATVSSRRASVTRLFDCHAANNHAWGCIFLSTENLLSASSFILHNSISPFTSDFKSSFAASSLS